MKHYICTILLLSVIGCSGPAVPGVDQLKKDLIGYNIPTDIVQRRTWMVTADEVKKLDIQQRFTDKKANTDEVHVSITLSDSKGTAEGVLVMAYKGYEQGWKLVGVDGSLTRYLGNGNGAIIDNYSRLMWVKDGNSVGCNNGKTLTWADAITFCKGLTYAGYSDWRLPNKDELVSIVDSEYINPAINTAYFTNTKSDMYWTSTTHAPNTSDAWYVNFTNGNVYYIDKTANDEANKVYVRCVRVGP